MNPDSDNLRQPNPSSRSALTIVFLVVFIDLLGFGIVLPLLPRYAEAFIEPLEISKALSGTLIAVLFSSFSAMQFFFAPLWGRLSDRIGRKPVLLIGLMGSVVFYTLFGLASELPTGQAKLALFLMFLSRSGAGIAGATIATAQAVIADCTTKENRSRGMALIGIAFGIGFTFGPLIAWAGMSLFSEYRGGPGYLAAGLSFLAFIYGLVKMPETRKIGEPSVHRGWLKIGKLYETLSIPTVGALVFIFFLATFAFAGFESTLSLMTKKALNYSDRSNYLLFAYIGFTLMFAQGFFFRKLAKTWPDIRLLRSGLAMLLAGMICLIGATVYATHVQESNPTLELIALLFAMTVTVFGFAFMTPSVQAMISKQSDPNRQGEVLGVNQSFSALARIIGPLIGLSIQPLDLAAPYVFSALLLLWVGLLARRLNRV